MSGKPSSPLIVLSTGVYCFLFPSSYDHEGRLTNVTRPTGVVTSLHREMEKSITIDIENSNRDDDVTVITNLSSVEASYTVVQGKPHPTHPPRPRAEVGATSPERASHTQRALHGFLSYPKAQSKPALQGANHDSIKYKETPSTP